MDLTAIKHLFGKPSQESIPTSLLRRAGFVCVAIVELILNINFFTYLGESWVMPFAGATLVLMEVWHWVSAQTASGIRKIFHYTAWLAICLVSIMAVVSFGQAITTVSADDSVKAVQQIANQDAIRNSMLQNALQEQKTYQDQIDAIIAKQKKLSAWDTVNSTRLAGDLKTAQEAKARADSNVLLYSGVGSNVEKKDDATKASPSKSVANVNTTMNARLIFSQIFTEKYATLAIRIFFIIFGLAMELTLCLSAMPPKEELTEKNIMKRGPRGPYRKRQLQTTDEVRANTIDAVIPDKIKNALSKQLNSIKKEKAVSEENESPINDEEEKFNFTPLELNPEEPSEVTPIEVKPVEEVVPVEIKPVEVTPVVVKHIELTPVKEDEPVENKMKSAVSEQIAKIAAENEPQEPSEKKHAESETAFLFVETPTATLDDDGKKTFMNNISKIFGEIKNNGDHELSIKEISNRTKIEIEEIKKMFKFFYNRNLLAYDDSMKRWKFKLNKDNIINYLRDKNIQL